MQFGKVPIGVGTAVREANVPVLCICGGIGAGAEGLFDVCESTIQTTVSKPMALSEAIENARTLYLGCRQAPFPRCAHRAEAARLTGIDARDTITASSSIKGRKRHVEAAGCHAESYGV